MNVRHVAFRDRMWELWYQANIHGHLNVETFSFRMGKRKDMAAYHSR